MQDKEVKMIKCDLCNKLTDKEHINTIIIQKQTIDYCDRTKCKNKMQQVIMCWKRIQKYECLLYEKRLKERKKEFINKIVGGKTNGKTI